jgi:peptidyl-tRNA hydrolase, PTH1 family
VVGLGNPGAEFAGTRHNVGADAAAALADRHQGRLKPEKGLHSEACEIRIGERRVLVAVPHTFMNESGRAVAPLVRRSGIEQPPNPPSDALPSGGSNDGPLSAGISHRLVVIHDELDLPPGRVKIKAGGGTAGNNGLKSIHSHLHDDSYLRVRIGIGKPPGRQPGADYVLRRPGAAERAVLAVAIEEAADAVESIVTLGLDVAMNRVNAS